MIGTSQAQASTPERQRILDVLIEHGELSPLQISQYIDSTSKNISNILCLMRQEGLVVNGNKRGLWKVVRSKCLDESNYNELDFSNDNNKIESYESSFNKSETHLSYDNEGKSIGKKDKE